VENLGAVVGLAQKLLTANKGRWSQATTGSVRPGQETYVYGRANAPCRRCGTLIQREMQADRVTFWCPACQPLTPAKRPATSRPT
jgi:endonuclease-8